MLQIQRASAGSGKTYALAKKFIRLLISEEKEEGKRRLKTEKEIIATLPSIMAITFTNKATNEMKQRIVEKLSKLAMASDINNLTPEFIKNTDYLKELANEFDTDFQRIGETSQKALSALLNKYSDFRVSTIDAFFQEILRTFTYEANLNDTYQLEIDSDYLGKAAIDTTINDIDQRIKGEATVSFWLNVIMQKASSNSTKWNIFNKSESKNSIYSEIKSSLIKLENEEFKKIKSELDSIFKGDGSELIRIYTTFKERAEKERRETLERIKELAEKTRELADEYGAADSMLKLFANQYDKIRSLGMDGKLKISFSTVFKNNSLFKANSHCRGMEEINDVGVRMYKELDEWLSMSSTPLWPYWIVYGELMPYLGLMAEIDKRINDFLETNNLIRIADTSYLLKRIIGDSDTPFIYERMGSRLKHFLIDEFQDTSKMQWDVLYPLLNESEGYDYENLIIGDAKQSIYRFRNADSSLITEKVPSIFKNHQALGGKKEENTNWRSARNIVEFNNSFFRLLSQEFSGLSRENGMGKNIENLYGNVVQFPSQREDSGYVEIRFIEESGSEGSDFSNEEEKSESETLNQLGPLVKELKGRGYEMKDIAILVSTNKKGKEVVDALLKYNTILPDKEKIEVISEESLYVSSSEAVEIILTVIERMAMGKIGANHKEKETKGKDDKFSKINWHNIKTEFLFYSLRHPELSVAEKMQRFLNDEEHTFSIEKMLEDMPATTLPAIVEATVENFIPEGMRHDQAIFISAFQDLVIEYSSRYSSDPGSFLEWWNKKGVTVSVSSPEGTNAIQVMTIHKSKGLEFKCVIIPFANEKIVSPGKTEWRWEKPVKLFEDLEFPQRLPVKTDKNLLDTPHADVYREYYDQVLLDKINTYYVAFTRSVDELYIFTKTIKKNSLQFNVIIKEILEKMKDEDISEENIIPSGKIIFNEEGSIITIGEKGDSKGNKKEKKSGETVNEYYVNSERPILHTIGESDETTVNINEEDDEEDPRSEGNLLHSVMSLIEKRNDVDKALLTLRMSGVIGIEKETEWKEMLDNALCESEVEKWFDGSAKVYNERSIINKGHKKRRPDRIMIFNGGKEAIVVDYKFGDPEHRSRYYSQVRGYVRNLKAITRIENIKGYLWYLKEGKIFEVY